MCVSLIRFCGSINPGRVMSYANTMMVLFRSDVSISMEGFSAIYTAVNSSTGLSIISTYKPAYQVVHTGHDLMSYYNAYQMEISMINTKC